MAIADESYFDWQVLPEAPSSLIARVVGNGVQLVWQTHDGAASNIVKRRAGDMGSWSRIAKSVGDKAAYVDDSAPAGVVCYRVRSANLNGESPYSNIVRVRR
jgi:hypothetical protein